MQSNPKAGELSKKLVENSTLKSPPAQQRDDQLVVRLLLLLVNKTQGNSFFCAVGLITSNRRYDIPVYFGYSREITVAYTI